MTTGDHEDDFVARPLLRTVGVGDIIRGRFVLEEELGSGGMGRVFKALDLRRQEAHDRHPHVALKLLTHSFEQHPASFMALQREARRSLAHPNIIQVFDFDRDGSLIFLVMEYLRGRTLRDIFVQPGFSGLSLSKAMQIIRPVGEALRFAHDHGIVHSDLKPGNIFLTDEKQVKVIDFGIARAFRRADAAGGEATVFDSSALRAFSPRYASPEMIDGDEADPRDDIFSLACITYEMLSGHHPFGGKSAAIARNKERRPDKPPGLTRPQWSALKNGLAFSRSERTPSVESFLAGLERKPGWKDWPLPKAARTATAASGLLTRLDPRPVWKNHPRLRGTIGIIALCIMAVVTGATGYILGQVGMKPMEVVRVILQPEPVVSKDDIEDRPLHADNDAVASSPASETAPAPETGDRVPTVAPPAVTPPPTVALAPEVAVEPVEPEPSEGFAGTEAEGEAPGALADAVETAGEGQDANAIELPSGWTPPPLGRLSTSAGDDDVHDTSSGNDAAAEPGRTSAAAQDPVRQHASSPAVPATGDEQEAAGNDRSSVGFAERGEPLASVPAVEEPVVRLQRDSMVMRAQALLAQLDLYRDAVDGLLGKRTIAAIRDFQKSMSMAETGKVNAALLKALEAQVETMEARAPVARSESSGRPRQQGSDDPAVEAEEKLQTIDIIDQCRGKDGEWVYIMAINRQVLCGGLSAESPN